MAMDSRDEPMIGRIPEKFFNAESIFAIDFIFYMLLVFQGLDVTHLGFFLTHQVYAVKFPVNIEYIWPITFFTDFIGGLWLSLIGGSPNVLWARIGGVLLSSLNAAIAFSILSDYFERKRTFLVVLISSLFITTQNEWFIHYYTFPAFLMILELWVFNKAQRSYANTIGQMLYAFLFGFIAIPIVLSRITLVLFLIAPFILLVYCVATKKDLQVFKRLAFLAGSGFFCSIGVFGLFYWHIGLLQGFIHYIFWISSQVPGSHESHGLMPLVMSYAIQWRGVVIGSALLISGLYLISKLSNNANNNIAKGLIIVLTLIVLGIKAIFPGGLLSFTNSENMIVVSVGLLLLLSGLFLYVDRGQSRNLTLLMLMGIFVMLVSPIGSINGLGMSFHGMWLIMPLSILCAYDVRDRIENPRVSSMLSLLNGLLVAVLIASLFFQATNVFRDDPNRLHLNTAFHQPSLKYIYSTPERAKVIDELLEQMDKYVTKGDDVLIVDSLPLIYYLTETTPALGNPWIEENVFQGDVIKKQLELEQEGRYPKLFITAKVNTRGHSWPSSNSVLNENASMPNIDTSSSEYSKYLKDRYINYLHYSLVWENEAFRIYKRGG
jgi:hypothetical protein